MKKRIQHVIYHITGIIMICSLVYIYDPFRFSVSYISQFFSEYYYYPLFRILLFFYVSLSLFLIILPKFKDNSKTNIIKWIIYVICIIVAISVLTDAVWLIFSNYEISFGDT